MRSDTVKKGFERAPHRSLLKAAGVTDADMGKPFIAVCNSFVEIVPGHVHLNRVGRYVKECIREAGGVAFEFNTIGVDDGIAMGHAGMKYSLPSRELIADCVETMIEAHCFGAKFAVPCRDVWVIAGAGGFQMTQAELSTAAQEGIKVNVAIINNGYLGMVCQ